MCRIRIIKKASNGNILKDTERDFSMISINPIDRPAYITHYPTDNGYMEYIFTYVVKNEETANIVIPDQAIVEFGTTSGRIKKVSIKRDLSIQEVAKSIFRKTKYEELSLRGQDNFKGYIDILCDIISSNENI